MSLGSLNQNVYFEKEMYFIHEGKLKYLIDDSSIFSNYEQDYCQQKSAPLPSIAGFWCAKCAFTSATKLKLGFSDFRYLDLEIRHSSNGQPKILIHNELANWFNDQSISVGVSIAHTKTIATSIILFWKN
jgi:holo-[acyl-carrier protein] synthase